MTPDLITEKLTSTKSAERRKAAKAIGKSRIPGLGPDLHQAYLKEKKDQRTWETQVEMIRSLGLIDYKNALEDIQDIIKQNIPTDMIPMAAATAYVRLKRESIHDAKVIIDLLHDGSYSIVTGVLEALAADQMMPSAGEIQEITKACWDIHKHKDRVGVEYGLIDPRIFVAIACANWDKELTHDFLHHCIDTAYDTNRFGKPVLNQDLVKVCENSLKGKVSKAYIPQS